MITAATAIYNIIKAFWTIFLNLTGGLYDFICYVYDIFYYLCGFNLFGVEEYSHIVQNIYVILSIIMVFVLSYSLLQAVINPDNFAKGETSFPKLVKNVVISLVIIVVLPTVFEIAFNVQNAFLNNNVIQNLILGNAETTTVSNDRNGVLSVSIDGVSDVVSGGRIISFYTFQAFMIPSTTENSNGETVCKADTSIKVSDDNFDKDCRHAIQANGHIFVTDGTALDETDSRLLTNNESFTIYSDYSEELRSGNLRLYALLAPVAAIFILWVLLNFCFDMALRVIKLAFYQLIAPIPVVCRIIPGGKMKDVFPKWVKQVVSLFFEVFVRIAALSLGVYLIGIVVNYFVDIREINGSFFMVHIIRALLIMSIIMFVKQIPKLISDLFGIDTGGMKLGLKEKLREGGAFVAGSTLGGIGGTIGRNAIAAGKNIRNADGWKNKMKAGALGVASIGAGGLSGAVRGFKAGKGAKNFGDVKKASGSAVAGATQAREKRDAYRAAHKGKNFLGTGLSVAWGHITDTADAVGGYFGFSSIGDLIEDNKRIDDINSKKKAIRTAAEDLIIGESNKQGVSKSFGLKGSASVNGRTIAYDTAILRSMRQAMESAKASGASNAGLLQDEYDAYLKQFTDAVQNQALLGEKSFGTMLDEMKPEEARALQADLGEVRSAASNFRKSIRNNLTATYIADCGFNASMVDNDMDLTLKDPAMDALGDTLKIAKNKNIDRINDLREQEQANNKQGN